MKIAWFTPFSEISAIGKHSQVVTDELAKLADVTLWVCDEGPIVASKLPICRYELASDIKDELLSGYDCVVYNLGNHLPFHREIYHASQRVPGIVILHDYVMHHFFAGYYLDYLQSAKLYTAAIERLYGRTAVAMAREAFAGQRRGVWNTDEVVNFPFFEDAVRGAYGVFVHSTFLRECLAVFPGPVGSVHLAYDLPHSDPVFTREDLGIPADKLLVITVGNVNPNKRINSVIRVLARAPDLAERMKYLVLGSGSEAYLDELDELVRQNHLQDVVQLCGYQPDEKLYAYLTHADLCINLRVPAIEGASASLVEALLYGKPVIVSNTGCYAELPDDCVCKISLMNEEEDLALALEFLLSNENERRQMADRGRRFAEEHCRPARYAEAFLEFVNEVQSLKPVLGYAKQVGRILVKMGVDARMPIIDTVARASEELFAPRNGSSETHQTE